MRIAFAWMLVACSSAPRESPPPPRIVPDVAIDAALAAPATDAALAFHGPCDWSKPDSSNPRCAPEHQPLMRCRDVNGPSARFPKCIEDRPPVVAPTPIRLAIERRGVVTQLGIHVVVGGGTNRGIDKRWRAVLVDAKQHPIRGGALSYVRLDPDEIECAARLTADELATATAVEFRPPP